MKKKICTLLYRLGLCRLAYRLSPSVATYLAAKDVQDIVAALTVCKEIEKEARAWKD